MSIQIHTATREESNNRAMLAPESKTRSGIVLRAISLGSLEILRQLANPLSTAEADLSAVDMRVLAEFLWVHGAPIEEVLDTVYNTPTQVARKAAAFSRHPECQRRTPAGCRRPGKPKRAHPALVASWVFTIARATGWSEERILWMPLRRAMQYAHAAWISEGIRTGWRHATAEEAQSAQALYERLKPLTRHG